AYWHQLFNPRQLLINGLFAKVASEMAIGQKEKAMGLLVVNKVLTHNSKLSMWNQGKGNEKVESVFTNQALNTLYNFGNRAIPSLDTNWYFNINNTIITSKTKIKTKDARDNNDVSELWITDPPYADAVNYHKLTEFFLA